jgi:sarcosine oxidase
MSSLDVIVLGLGGMGSAAAFHLAARGRRVLGLERYTSPHDRGSSHGATRVIRQAYFEHPSYVPLLLRAYELWRELERRTQQPLLLLPGGLMLGRADSAVVAGSLRSAREHRLAHELLDAQTLRARFPQFHVHDDTVALFEPTAGLVWCERSVAAHLDAAAACGATLQFEQPALRWRAHASGEGVEVTTSRGTCLADRLILTPGPWAPQVLEELGLPLEVTRQVLVWFQPPRGVTPFAPDRFPVYICERAPGEEVYGFPAVDGPRGGVKAAFFQQPHKQVVTPETVERAVRAADVSDLRAPLDALLPGLAGEVVQAKVCLYTSTPDSHFIICPHPQHPQVSVACGFSGHGFKFCSVVGEILADLATHGSSSHDLTLFSPRRFSSITTQP